LWKEVKDYTLTSFYFHDIMFYKGEIIVDNELRKKIENKITEVGDCWIWVGSVDSNGKPRLNTHKVFDGCDTHFIQHIMYQEKFGNVDARYLDNLCGNLRCVNPDHQQPRTIEVRLSNFSVDEDTGCWLWNGTIATNGYGYLRINKHNEFAHRASYAHHNGVEIPEGLMVCHTCNVRRCINPEHLYLGTHNDNMRDMAQSNVMKGEDNPKALLTKEQVIEIKQHISERRIVYREIGRMYGVSRQAIKDIATGRTWAWVDEQ